MVRLGDAELAAVEPASGGFPPHSHDEYVISVNVVGHERVRLDRATFEVGTEEVTLYNPGQVQSCRTEVPDGVRWSCVSMYVAPEDLQALTGGRAVEFAHPVVFAPDLRSSLLRAATSTAAGTDEASRRIAAERLEVLLVALLERAVLSGDRPSQGAGSLRLQPVLERLRDDLSCTPPLAELAALVGLSREQLIRSFTRAMGVPPYAWHLQLRVAQGRRLLRGGQSPSQVAHLLGFSDQSHFHRRFRDAYGQTPGRFRRTRSSTTTRS
jgi:AraC family chemosensory pili system transcriptional regulator ChpD